MYSARTRQERNGLVQFLGNKVVQSLLFYHSEQIWGLEVLEQTLRNELCLKRGEELIIHFLLEERLERSGETLYAYLQKL